MKMTVQGESHLDSVSTFPSLPDLVTDEPLPEEASQDDLDDLFNRDMDSFTN